MGLPDLLLVRFAKTLFIFHPDSSPPGDTNVLASLSGPIEVRLAAELPSKATFEVLVRPLANVPATESKSLAATIRSSLEPALLLTKNPRSLVQLVVQSLTPFRNQSSGSSLTAAMINSSGLALINAGSVPMCGVVTAVAVGRTHTDSLIIDPSDEESESLRASGFFAFLFATRVGSKNSEVDCVCANWKSSSGGYDEKGFFEAKELARCGAYDVYKTIRRSVSQHMGFSAELEEVGSTMDENESEDDLVDDSDEEKMII